MKRSIPVLLVSNGLASVGLSILNKSIATSLDAPLSVVGIQNVCAALCTLMIIRWNPDLVKPFRRTHLPYIVPITILFVLALWTSLLSLRYVPLPIYAIAGYTRPIFSCVFEYIASGTLIKRSRLIGLLLIIAGSVVASGSLDLAEYHGFGLALVNTVIVSLLSVVENKTMKKIGNQQTPMGVNMYRLVFSIPILFLMAAAKLEYSDLFLIETDTQILLILSGFICLFSGIIMYALQAVTTSTTLLVANAGYKFITSIASIFVHSYAPPAHAIVGYMICTCGFLAYSLV